MNLRAWFLPLAASAFALLSIPAAGDEPPLDADTLLAKIRAAAGPVPSAYRETDVTVVSDGLTTTEYDYRRGKDFRFVFDTGPFHTERGVHDGSAWHMNDNGQVVFDEPDPGLAARERTTTTVRAVHTPVEGYLIATLNARGDGSKQYVDGARWYVARRERITPNGTVVTTYDDVREDHGRVFAHHAHTDNGYAHTTSDMRITEYVTGDVADAQVAVPSPLRALVTFPAGVTSVDLPAKFGHPHVYVRVMIGDRGLDFVLDTGASGITIDSAVAHELGLPEYGKRSAVTAGRYTTYRTIVPQMRVGGLTMKNVAVQVVPQGWHAEPEVKEVGLLGFDFLAELGVTIDYEHERVTVVSSGAYTPPSGPNTIPLAVRIGSGQPHATASVNGAVGEHWVLDTGGAGTFLIFDRFSRVHPEALRDEGRDFERDVHLYGIGGDIPARPYQIASLKLGSVNFTHFVGYRVTSASTYAGNDDGIIGPDFLRLFTLSLDYADSRVFLVPNKDGRAAMGIK
ncbi:MAG TPA: aspartyl protease family protein [Candidatus Elarobacter sp.]|jgi:predicted aspartyl protease|nr:aspartyl protease family protein [Candidatus Elarobacter sp.]